MLNALPQDWSTVQSQILLTMVLEEEEEDVWHAHQVLDRAPRALTAFPVQEEEEDLPEDFLRLEVDFGEVFEKEQEDSALMDLLGKLCLNIEITSEDKLFDRSQNSSHILALIASSFLVESVTNTISEHPDQLSWSFPLPHFPLL